MILKPLVAKRHLCRRDPVSNGSQQPEQVGDLFFNPYGDRVGRCVQFVGKLLALIVENSTSVKGRNKVDNKRYKWNKREWEVSILSTEDNKLGEPPKVSL